MSRLVSLEMDFFQPHKHRLIEFDENVSCIVGSNGSGKSAAIRAIRWVAFNRPLGDSVICWGAKYTRVVLKTEAVKITREKGDEGNLYRMDRKAYQAFGTGVPDAITSALELHEINFQRQVDATFWFSLNAGEAAREMNRVVDLDVIDRSQAYAAAKVKTHNSEIKILDGLLAEAVKRRDTLSWVPVAERLLEDAQRIAQDVNTATRRLQGVQRLLEEIEGLKSRRVQIPDTKKVEASIVELTTLRERLEGMERLVSSIKQESRELCELRTEISQLEAEVERTRPSLCPTCKQVIPTAPS